MKYYSETLNKLFETEKDLLAEEKKVKEAEAAKIEAEKAKKEARATRAKEVEKALKDADAAQSKAQKLLTDFIKDYGYFHTTYSLSDTENHPSTSFVDLLTSFLGEF